MIKINYRPLTCFIISAMLLTAVFAFAGGSPADAKSARAGSKIVFGGARFTVITPMCVRMEYNQDGKFIDAPSLFAAGREAGFTGYKTSGKNGVLVIDTGVIRIEYKPDDKPFSPKNLSALIRKGGVKAKWHPGDKNKNNLGGARLSLDLEKGAIPLSDGILSRDGWYLLDDSKSPVVVSNWVANRPAGAGTDWYLFGYGHDYAGALKSFTTIGGAVPLPRKYVLGAWYSRYWPYSSNDFRTIVKQYKKEDFPLDVIVMDMDWHREGWTGWSWNRRFLPDAEDLLKWFHEQGLFVSLNTHPENGVGPHEDCYSDFMKDMGRDPAARETIPYDIADRKQMETLFTRAHNPLENQGVDFWWVDLGHPPVSTAVPGVSELSWLNTIYFQHSQRNNMRGISFSRWGGWGDHRHPIHFSGDTYTGFPMLAFEIPFTAASGNSGVFFWTHDIGGFTGPRNEESYARWAQFGAVSAALRSHSTRQFDLDKRPWQYPKWAENSMRISFHLRSVLFPYIYSSAWQSTSDSVPLVRPMYLARPDAAPAYANPQEYLFGDNILAAPVVEPGVGRGRAGRQAVWFPGGVWFNWFTGEKFAGRGERLVSADINEFPLYVRAGVPIPMQPYTQRMSTTPLTNLVVRCYPGQNGKAGKYTLYEDDGVSQDYLHGAYALTRLAYTRNAKKVTVVIGPAKGTFAGQPKAREYTIELPATRRATHVKVDGKPAKSVYDENEHMNRIHVPARAKGAGVRVTAVVEESDPAAAKAKADARRASGMSGK